MATTTTTTKPLKDPATVIRTLLSNPTDATLVRSLVAKNATYVSLNYSNPDLQKIMPYCGTHAGTGAEAIIYTFSTVGDIWATEAFDIQALFAADRHNSAGDADADSDVDVAVFGSFTYKSRNLGKSATSPFSIWAKVNGEGKITYMQFMEDTLATAATFKVGGSTRYQTKAEWGEVEF